MGNGGKVVSTLLFVHSKIQIGDWILRIDSCSALKMQVSLFCPSLNHERHGYVIFSDEIIPSDLESMSPEGQIVAPVPDLPVANKSQNQQHNRASGVCGNTRRMSCLQQVSCAPAHHDEETNKGDIGVTVRHGLHADLHQTDHRYQGSEEPQPPNQKIAAAGHPDQNCDREQPQ